MHLVRRGSGWPADGPQRRARREHTALKQMLLNAGKSSSVPLGRECETSDGRYWS